MDIKQTVAYVKSLVPNNTYYAFSYPTTSKDDCVLVLIHGGMPTENTGVRRPTMQFLVRGKPNDSSGALKAALALYEEFKYKEEIMIGDTSVTYIQALQSYPIWTGTDEAKRPIFSLNFQLTIRRK
ncbi:minor capsid protein [Bacillus sp. FSL M8-0063]|uniref:minor capsid protein n=1 Tax=Bacillus sp. FSL M8-0063 TaxID=2921566 RepID=UPI0030F7AE7C